LKKKYTEDSPAKLPSSSPDPLRLKPIARSGSSLIAAAKQADQSEQSEMLQNLCARFKNLKQYQISQIIARHKTDVDRAVAELLYMDNQAKPSVHRTSSSTSFSSSTHPTYPSSPMTAHTHTSSNTIRPHVSSPASAHSSAVKANKPKNNEKSRIYANRENGHKSKRRDPDESESEAEAQGSDGDSENDWSGDDGGRKKKKRRMNDDEDDVDAEGAALKAFNEATVDVLTGTIGKSSKSITIAELCHSLQRGASK
jgi:SWI/SNF-related matrix-associated actin-dependent regulator 1 of chromatin subfamily A